MKKRKFLFLCTEGLPFILVFFFAGGVFLYFRLPLLATPFFILALFSLQFFRDPERIPEGDESSLISPADGKVVETADSVHFSGIDGFEGEYRKLSIFMSVVSVHVNRAPREGVVKSVFYKSGEFLPADKQDSSDRNESNMVAIQDRGTGERFLVKQIAGIIARRIICWTRTGDLLEKGQRFGMIRFGSRVEILFPKNFAFSVKIGDTVYAGKTEIGRKS